MEPLEEAFGLPLGAQGGVRALEDTGVSPYEALSSVLLGALAHPPCLVAFSGGRDSSMILAVACVVARSSGLPPPIPVTALFPAAAATEERDWQEQVVTHLGLSEWERVEIIDELDFLGPYSRRLLLACGNLWPFNVHFSAPLAERAHGGTLVTGSGGDEVFGISRFRRAAHWLAPGASVVEQIAGRAAEHAPGAIRRWAIRGELDSSRAWMRPPSRRRAARRWDRWSADHPVRRDRALREWLWPSRYWQVAMESLELVGQHFGATVVSPFMTAEFVAAAAARMGAAGFTSRAEAIEGLLGQNILPTQVVHRRDKAVFDGAFFATPSRSFAQEWDGGGLGNPHVDVDRLAQEFRTSPRPDARSYSLLKAAWLGAQALP